MAGSRPRSDSGRSARGHSSIWEDARLPYLKRWDGMSKTSRYWNKLRRDPELWERNGNCLVYLYGKGEPKRGPSFKLPFSALLATSCFPLIERFLVMDGVASKSMGDLARWDQTHPRSAIQLFIPAPPSSTEAQALQYHLAIRNLFAWVLGKPMAADHLGNALVDLRESLHEFRSVVDNDDNDLINYIRKAGYLDMAEEPSYALAILHLAETFQIKELYSKAFAHCVGMYGRLANCQEYQLTSSMSRKLIKKARINLNAQHLQASDMLRSFLDDELSEAYLGIPPGTRAHLERFRCFLLSFYSTKLGYYPPKAFSPGLLRSMHADFKALYKLLVDDGLTSTDTMPPTHVGGICTLQLVQSFDERHKFETRKHPLPQLPYIELPNSARLMTWFTRGEKLTSSQRQVTHAALIKSSNWTAEIFKNDLVRAYRKFEQDSILSPNKADKDEKVSVLDARKVRWILIYAIYQILSRATKRPAGVGNENTSYHLNVSTEGLPPWKEKYELKDEFPSPAGGESPRIHWGSVSGRDGSPGMIEIKPDIDYLSLVHKDRRSPSLSNASEGGTPALSRSSSFSVSLRRNSTLRRSIRRLKPGPLPEAPQEYLPNIPFHEIMVQGYGNGTHDVVMTEPEEGLVMKGNLTGRSSSTASSQSNTSSRTASTLESMGETVDTLPSTVASLSPLSPIDDAQEMEMLLSRWGPQDKLPSRTDTLSAIFQESSSERGAAAEPKRHTRAFDKCALLMRKRGSHEAEGAAPGNSPRRYTMMSDMRKKPNELVERLVAVRIRDSVEEHAWANRRPSDDWSIMQAFMDGAEGGTDSDEMAQYADLGGLIDLRG